MGCSLHLEGEWRAAERDGRAKQEVRDCELQSHAMSSLAMAEMKSGSRGNASLLPWPGDISLGSSQLLCLRTFLLRMREVLSVGW